jgi:uncharacterized protein YdhG (YjbR/CyaY superfamily)
MPTKKATADNSTGSFSDFEKQAMKARAKELAAEARAKNKREAGEKVLLDAIAAMPQAEKVLAKKVHQIVSEVAPHLMPKTWYGMPAYATKEDKVVCFFQSGTKYESRYCTLGFTDKANLDEGKMWAAGFALTGLTPEIEQKIAELVKQAVS